MTGRVDYQIEKYLLTEAAEPERLTRQWAEVLEECREQKSGAEDRLRLALLNVDYVTSFELPFRLLLTRAPQLIDAVRKSFSSVRKMFCLTASALAASIALKGSGRHT
jgi:hypothetical protein